MAADFARRVSMYAIRRFLKGLGLEPRFGHHQEWEVSIADAIDYISGTGDEGADTDEDEICIYDKIGIDFQETGMPIEAYQDFGVKVFTVDLTIPEIEDPCRWGQTPDKKEVRQAYLDGTKGMSRRERSELLRTYMCGPQDIVDWGYQKIYYIRFPDETWMGVDLPKEFQEAREELLKMASWPMMITNKRDLITLAGVDYVEVASSIPTENEPYRCFEYGENVFNYAAYASLFLLQVIHYYIKEQGRQLPTA